MVTGEGATDWQSVFGKVMQGVGVHCKAHHIPAVAIVGSMGKGAEDIYAYAVSYTHLLADENDWVKGMKVVKMQLGEPDASGRRRPEEIPGSEYEIELDTVIMSLGTSPNLSLIHI